MKFFRTKTGAAAFFSLFFFFEEVLLKAFSGSASAYPLLFAFLFSAGAGILCAGISALFSGRGKMVWTLTVVFVTSLFFTVEGMIRSVFRTYMTPVMLIREAADVTSHYTSEVSAGVLYGALKGLTFFMPFFLYIAVSRRRAAFGAAEPEKKSSRIFPVREAAAAFMISMALLLTMLGGRICGYTGYGALYGTGFAYNEAAENFGLITATRLSLQYRIFGKPAVSFHAAEGEDGDGTARSGEPSVSDEGESGNTGADGTESSTGKEDPGAETPAAEADRQEASGSRNILPLNLTKGEESENADVQSLTAYIKEQEGSCKNAYTGLFEGKNLILICAESYCGSFITEELTPTLWRLTHSGFYFSDYYQPEWGGSTTTGEVSYLLGLAPRDGDESMVRTKDSNLYFTLGNQLQRQGYASCAFHGGAMKYYRRDLTHTNLGYHEFIANENGLSALCGGSYPIDSLLFEKTLPMYLEKEPFSIYYMTISGHASYDKNSYYVRKYYDEVDKALGSRYKEKTKYYICYQMELEHAMTVMVEALEDAGIADDTVIVLVGDHYPYGLGTGEVWRNDENYINDLIKADSSVCWNEDKNTLILWSGCLEKEDREMACEISTPVTSLDIVPTLSNLFGLPYDSRLLPGRDVFSDAAPLVYWSNMSWITERGRYDSGTKTFTPAEGYEAEPGYIKMTGRAVENKLMMSRVILDEDYYGILFGKDIVTDVGERIFEPVS